MEGYFIILKRKIQEHYFSIMNTMPQMQGHPHMFKKKLLKLKSHIDSPHIMGDYNTLFLPMDRSSRQKVGREIMDDLFFEREITHKI